MNKTFVAISNHGSMVGGGEYSFLDLMGGISEFWLPIVVVPEDGVLVERLKKKSVPARVIPLPEIRPWSLAAIYHNLALLRRVCVEHAVELIYANGSRAAFYGGLVGKIVGIPTIWHCRVADRDPKLDWMIGRIVTQIVANSRATARRFENSLRSKVAIVHNGIDLEWFHVSPTLLPALADGNQQIILVVARLSKWKRHDLILSAFEQIGAAHPSAHLVCIGSADPYEGEWSYHLREVANKSVFRERIHWMGEIADLRPWYSAASLLVLASHCEPFGRVLVEAMACGLPVVATQAGGVPEIVRDGTDGLLVSPGDSEGLAAAVMKLLSDGNLRFKMGVNARKRSEEFNLSRHVHLMREIFDVFSNSTAGKKTRSCKRGQAEWES